MWRLSLSRLLLKKTLFTDSGRRETYLSNRVSLSLPVFRIYQATKREINERLFPRTSTWKLPVRGSRYPSRYWTSTPTENGKRLLAETRVTFVGFPCQNRRPDRSGNDDKSAKRFPFEIVVSNERKITIYTTRRRRKYLNAELQLKRRHYLFRLIDAFSLSREWPLARGNARERTPLT